ncbi:MULTISPECIES: hypothetical protein [unclassified Thermotoga]|uniref:hypothetical protein n=1 Tax=unclassified Thermotoga TaxID=2631113 RepID=UPI000280E73C|nr:MULTISPECIES: hypothetical protein [unclassified Thermotoga]AIY85813.1 hypothetical protein T2812B_01310 [Thermotoga sp. 2812B]EJX26900.1 hypothetical protein EMP_01467 [Thermotoga sp. EMP]
MVRSFLVRVKGPEHPGTFSNSSEKRQQKLSLDDIKEVALAGRRFVFAHLTFLKNGKENWRIGAALLEKDLLQSVVFAVIDALVK